jgi:NAD-dependent deacetylase
VKTMLFLLTANISAMTDLIAQAAERIRKSSFTMAFTGAGISVESGIPPFRGENGLWNKYDPQSLELNYFYSHGEECWKFIRDIFYGFFDKAFPNPAHIALAEMETDGWLHAIVTQNIDNLHHMAGSKTVHEFHGNSNRLICPRCDTLYEVSEFDLAILPPRCKYDDRILKPDFVFFGEGIPSEAWEKSFESASRCEVCLVIGSTGEVVPASFVPRKARERGAFIVEVNPSETQFTNDITDIHLKGRAGEILPALLAAIREH